MKERIINSHKSIIFLEGSLVSKRIMRAINTKVPLIASDGAIRLMREYRLTPNYVVGDGDGAPLKRIPRGIKILRERDQDTTDFEKCMDFVKRESLLPCLVLGMNGGELDHILGNAEVLLKHSKGQDFYFIDTYQKEGREGVKFGIALTEKKKSFEFKKGTLLSLISFDEAILSTRGLKWELKEKRLALDGILALRNVTVEKKVSFSLKKGRALLIADISESWP